MVDFDKWGKLVNDLQDAIDYYEAAGRMPAFWQDLLYRTAINAGMTVDYPDGDSDRMRDIVSLLRLAPSVEDPNRNERWVTQTMKCMEYLAKAPNDDSYIAMPAYFGLGGRFDELVCQAYDMLKRYEEKAAVDELPHTINNRIGMLSGLYRIGSRICSFGDADHLLRSMKNGGDGSFCLQQGHAIEEQLAQIALSGQLDVQARIVQSKLPSKQYNCYKNWFDKIVMIQEAVEYGTPCMDSVFKTVLQDILLTAKIRFVSGGVKTVMCDDPFTMIQYLYNIVYDLGFWDSGYCERIYCMLVVAASLFYQTAYFGSGTGNVMLLDKMPALPDLDSDLSYTIKVGEKAEEDTGGAVIPDTPAGPDSAVDSSQAQADAAGCPLPSEKPADGQEAESDARPVLSDEWFIAHIEAISKEIVDKMTAFASNLEELDGQLSRFRADMREARAARETNQ